MASETSAGVFEWIAELMLIGTGESSYIIAGFIVSDAKYGIGNGRIEERIVHLAHIVDVVGRKKIN